MSAPDTMAVNGQQQQPNAPDPGAISQAMQQALQQAPNVGTASPAPPSLAPQPVDRSTQVAGGNLPALPQLIADLIHRPQSMQAPGPGQIATDRPISRAREFESFTSQLLYAMGQGFANEGRGPGSFGRGFGAAQTAPLQLGMQQQQFQQQQALQQAELAQRQAQTAQTQQATQQAGQMVTLPNGMSVPMPLAKVIAPQLFQAQGREESAQITGQYGLQKAQLMLGPLADVPEDLQQQFNLPAKLPLKMLNQAESAANKPLTVVQGAAGPVIANKQTGKTQSLGIGSPAYARPVQVSDPSVPGGVRYMPAGEAERLGIQSSTSAAVKIPEAVQKDFTSGKSAQTLNAFNTASDHLQILQGLGTALKNNSVPLINSFAQNFAQQTGEAAPVSFDMAKEAVAGEIEKTFKGQPTDAGINAIKSVISRAQSPEQLNGAINTALTLMNSKRQALLEQYNQGIKGAAAFPGSNNSKAGFNWNAYPTVKP